MLNFFFVLYFFFFFLNDFKCLIFFNTFYFHFLDLNFFFLEGIFTNYILYSFFLFSCCCFFLVIFCLVILVAFFTLFERKVMGTMQLRTGPNVVSFLGLLQPIADALKLLLKDVRVPKISNSFLFYLAPIYTFFLSLLSWAFLPITSYNALVIVDLNVLWILSFSSLSVFGVLLGGWASNNKYAFLGAIRSAAQTISYEVIFGFSIIPLILIVNSLDFYTIILYQEKFSWFFFTLFPCSILYLISVIAETNRAPFDLPEAEAELVAGYNIEYGGLYFALYFLAEYLNIFTVSFVFSLLFLGGWSGVEFFFSTFFYFFQFFFDFSAYSFLYLYLLLQGFFLGFKSSFVAFFIIWLRATLPRFRYDQLMNFCWLILLPLSLFYFFFILIFDFFLIFF